MLTACFIALLIVIGLGILDKERERKRAHDYLRIHACIYEYCPYKGDIEFTHGCGSCLKGSSCYILDSLHFRHPSWDYDRLDSIFHKLRPHGDTAEYEDAALYTLNNQTPKYYAKSAINDTHPSDYTGWVCSNKASL